MRSLTISRFGTAWFPTPASAMRYYRPYGNDRAEVQRKIDHGEIHIGDPPEYEGEVRRWIEDSRWHIEVAR